MFDAGVLTTALSGAEIIAAADFNGDGKLDLAVSSTSLGLSVLFGNGNGAFQSPVSVPNGGGCRLVGCMVAEDANGDGYPDIVIANGNIYFNNGLASFPTNEPTPVFGQGVAIGDRRLRPPRRST